MSRLKAPLKQWIKFGVAGTVYTVFSIWLGNVWIMIGLPVIFDLYITKYIPWSWWKKIENPTIKKIFEWADAIIFALVAVYFINLYLFQNYKIPTGSLEKTLLIGDHLFVSKLAYGPRTPNTPFSFPLVQHTFPLINCKSYLEKPQWESHRLKGFGKVKRNDIVVFNFPAGDTVALGKQDKDYEGLCYEAGLAQFNKSGLNSSALESKGVDLRTLCLKVGRTIVMEEVSTYGKVVFRPVDRRENYVKRCVGLPGDSLQVIDRKLYINGKMQARPDGVQQFCLVTSSQPFTEENFDMLGVSVVDYKHSLLNSDAENNLIYLLPLTLTKQEILRKILYIKSVEEINLSKLISDAQTTFPAGYNTKWTVDNYGPIWIPKAGETVALTIKNLPLYERVIHNYEGNSLEVREDKIYINGEIANNYTFAMDYYWMMGDSRHNSADSRVWGYVPEDHIVGQPLFVWLSLNSDKGWFGGKIRFNRFFKDARK